MFNPKTAAASLHHGPSVANDVQAPSLEYQELRELLAPLLELHGYPSDAAARMTRDVIAAAKVVPELLKCAAPAGRGAETDADVVACLMAAALFAQGRWHTARLHVALTLMESLAGLIVGPTS